MATDPTSIIAGLLNSGGLTGQAFSQGQDQAVQRQQSMQQLALQGAQMRSAMAQQANDAGWSSDVQAYNKNPTVDGLATLAMKYPKNAEMLQQVWKLKSDAAQRTDATQFGELYSAADGGHSDLVLKQLQSRRDADTAAGLDTSDEDHLIDMVQSKAPDALNTIKGMALAHLAAWGKGEFADQFKKAMGRGDPYTLAPGDVRYDSNNEAVATGAPKQQEPFHYTLKDASGQEHEYVYDPASGAAPPFNGGSIPLATRLNNPGAIRFDPKNQWQGQVGQQNGFAQFDTPENGQRAHRMLIANQIKAGFNTPLTWAQHYAPASDGNDPQAYAATIAKGLGIGVNDKIPLSAVPKVASLSAGVESGGTPAPRQNSSAAGPAGSRQIDNLPVNNGHLADAPGDMNKAGEGYLATLPANLRGTVKAIATGQMAQPTSFAMSKPYWQQIMAAVTQYDPTFDSSRQPERVAAAKAFTGNGKAAQTLASIDRFAYHVNDLYRDSQALTGWNLGPASGLFNAGVQSFQRAAVARYNAALPFIAGELQKLTKNGSATEGESKQIMANLAPTQPASARLAAMQQLAELTQGQFKPIRDQWGAAFPDGRPMPIDVSHEANAILDSLTADKGPIAIDPHSGKLAGARAAPPTGPVRVSTPAQAQGLKPGTHYIRPDGKVMVR